MARRQVSIFINGKEVANQIKSITAEKRKLTRELANMTRGSEEYNRTVAEIRRLNGIIGEHQDNLRDVESTWDKLKKGAMGFAGAAGLAFGISELVAYGKQLYRQGVEMDTLARKAETVLGPALDKATEASERHAAAMGLTNSEYVDAVTNIADFLKPMGFSTQAAADQAIEIQNLAGALSEWSGGQFSAMEVSDSFRKALVGEREELERYGISIKQSEVNAAVAAKGLEKLTGEALKQAEAMATLELIVQRSADAQRQYAQNSDSLVRSQSELQANIGTLQEKLATALIPTWTALTAVANGFVGSINDFLAMPMAKKLEEEQMELTILVGQITEANISQGRRNALIGELQDKYPDFLGNLDSESVTNEQLAERLNSVNKQYILKIALQKEDEKIQEQANKVADAARIKAEQENKVRRRVIELNNEYQLGLDFTNKSLQERIALTREALELRAKQEIEGGGAEGVVGIIYRRLIGSLDTAEGVLQGKLATQQGILDDLQKNRKEIEKSISESLGINLEAFNESPVTDTTDDGGTEDDLLLKAKKERIKAAQELQAKADQKEAERLAQQEQRLAEIVQKFRDDKALAALSDDEKKLEQLRLQYQKQIDLAKELEAKGSAEATQQRLELERMQQLAVDELRTQLLQESFDKKQEQLAEQEMQENLRGLEELERRAEFEKQVREMLRTEQEQAIYELDLFYAQILAKAEKYGIDTSELTKKYEGEKQAIEKEFHKKSQDELVQAQQAKLQALQSSFQAFGNLAISLGDLFGEEGKKSAKFQRAITLTQIALDTASAISSLTAASEGNLLNSVTFGAAGIAQFITGLTRIFANMAQAKKVLKTASVPQRFTGGFTDVIGATDGRKYSARYIGDPPTGMLNYNSPILTASGVLGNERGPEYFVSAADVQRPAVLDHIRAIENITRARQFQDGGATAPLPAGQAATAFPPEMMAMLQNINATLLLIQQTPRQPLIGDDEIVRLDKRGGKLRAVSGGTV